MTDGGKLFKITKHFEPKKSWALEGTIWPFAGVRWIQSRQSWSNRELLITDDAKGAPSPE